jgi:hypothetical protein
VAAHRVDKLFAGAARAKDFGSLDAVLFGVFLKVYVVEEARAAPEISLARKPLVVGEPLHNPLNSESVLKVKKVFVVPRKKLPCLEP